MSALLTWLAIAGLPIALALLWVWLDEWLADRTDSRRREQQDRETTPEWLALLAAVEPEVPPLPRRKPTDLSALPSVARIRDRIAANEAARIDDEWKAMNR